MPKPNIGQGDNGEAFLFGSGKRFPKDSAQFEAVGTVDELNSAIGYARFLCESSPLARELEHIQQMLFAVQAHVGTEYGYEKDTRIPKLTKRHITQLERTLVRYEKGLPPLRNFLLPGGSEAAAALHLCRTVARRAERRMVTLSREKSVNPYARAYINRLSDAFFVFARRVNQDSGSAETIWKP
jgi:cob(I)alamin adenosyltransferase